MRINRWLDFLDRVGWTALQAAAGAVVVVLTEQDISWQAAVKFVLVAAVLAAAKVVAAQNSGRDDLGAAVPGHVIER